MAARHPRSGHESRDESRHESSHESGHESGHDAGPAIEGVAEASLGSSGIGGLLVTAAGIAAYLVLSHWLTASAADQPWAVAALVGPIWLLCVIAAFHKGHRRAIWLLAVVAAGVGLVVSRGGIGNVHRLYLVEYIAIHLGLAASFGATLRGAPERLSLIEAIATRVHGVLTPQMRAYARKVTITWVVYFLAMATVSVLIYLLTPWGTWAMFANVLTPVCIAALFIGEHVLRYRLHPEFERSSLMDTIRAYRRGNLRTPA